MKKIKIIALLIFTCSLQTVYSQNGLKNKGYIDAYNFTPKENIYVHYNSSLLFAGEYLYYKVYNINTTLNQLSNLSKVVYVELIDKDMQQVFKHKISLVTGLGQGDYFISTSIPSGNYKLIAYTQWMKNGGKNYFYKDDINILNPYQSNQKSSTDSINNSKINTFKKSNNNFNNPILKLSTNDTVFHKRSKVSLSIKDLKNTLGYGDYSISVRKIDAFYSSTRSKASNYKKMYPKKAGVTYNEDSEVYYPEINGGVITGKVLYKESNLPAKGQNVSLSISGNDFIFKTETTNDDGVFNISVNENYDNETGILQVLGMERELFSLELNETPSVDLSELKFNSFTITPAMKDMIVTRSIYNQIENAYYSIKPDTIVSLPDKKPFYTEYNSKVYVLEEYTRFYTVKDIFIEIVENVWSTKNKEGNRVFYVNNVENANKTHLPLIFMDGVLIQNHEHLLNYNANKIKTISVLQGNAHFGTTIYQGVIIVETIDNEYKNLSKGDFLKKTTLFKPQPIKNYFHQNYNNNSNDHRIPDFRNQLLWNPSIKINTNEKEVVFYTSDNTGDFEICLEGFTANGNPITLQKIITVK